MKIDLLREKKVVQAQNRLNMGDTVKRESRHTTEKEYGETDKKNRKKEESS